MRIAVVCFLLLYSSSLISISDNAYTSHPSIERHLLQAKKPCPVNFEGMNYTIITGRCKGPNYSAIANICCEALKEFACPYRDELNDLSNDCSSIMLSYINRYGNYPPGLFASFCHDTKDGLDCDTVPSGPAKDDSNNKLVICYQNQLIVTAGLLVLLFL